MRLCKVGPSALLELKYLPEQLGNRGRVKQCAPVAFLLLFMISICARAQSDKPAAAPPMAPDEIVRRMVDRNEIRAEHLKYVASRRHYHVEFHGMGRTMSADMDVQATYSPATGKTFRVLDESGSRILLNHVLKRLLSTEQDESRQHEAALTPLNYNFKYVTSTSADGRQLYVFSVEPKVNKKLLYRGQIWVDAQDYAVVKVEAEPAVNPSFWIKSTAIHQIYVKDGEFWLPQENRSESRIRLGGSALLKIDYGTYLFDDPNGSNQSKATDR